MHATSRPGDMHALSAPMILGASGNMDSFEINKVLGALLGTIFIIFSITLLSGVIFHEPNPGQARLRRSRPQSGARAGCGRAEKEVPLATLLQNASADKGAAIFKRCEACHDGTKGGPNKVGPNLWNVVGRPIASHPGFSYSSAHQGSSPTTAASTGPMSSSTSSSPARGTSSPARP